MYQITIDDINQLDLIKIVEKLNKNYDVILRKEDKHLTILIEKRERKILQKVSK